MADRERVEARMKEDHLPVYSRDALPVAEERIVNAADYAAYHAGQINRKLDQIIEALAKLAPAED